MSQSKKIIPQNRDLDILKTLHDFRFLTTSQIAHIYFGNIKTAQQRLLKLYDQRFVDRRDLAVKRGEGSTEFIYFIGTRGAEHLAEETNISIEEIDQVRSKARNREDFHFKHDLGVNAFRLKLLDFTVRNDCKVLFWKYDHELKNKLQRGVLTADKVKDPKTGKMIRVAPDAFLGIALPTKVANYFFLEWETGKTRPVEVAKKMLGYARYYRDGLYQKKWGFSNFRVLVVCPERKLESYIKATVNVKDRLNSFYFISQEQENLDLWRTAENELSSLINLT